MTRALERCQRIYDITTCLYGAQEQAPTPSDVIEEMIAQIPNDLLADKKLRDNYCGRLRFLCLGTIRKLQQRTTHNDEKDEILLKEIIEKEVYANDIDPAFAETAKSTLKRMCPDLTKINLDSQDALQYNITMNISDVVSITNPPYQPPRGVKKGGNFYKPHVLNELKQCPLFGVTNIPMTFMVQDPLDDDNRAFRKALLDAGLKKIKHIRSDAYSANVLTIYAVWAAGYDGPVEFQTYDVDDPTQYHTLWVPRDQLYKLSLWPVARTQEEFDLAQEILGHVKKKYPCIRNKVKNQGDWCVEIEYLIGLEKERLNKKNPLRLAPKGPGEKVRGGSKSKFINCDSEAERDSLYDFMNTVGQTWFRTIPRGSSAENWMIGPLYELWRDKHKSDPLFEVKK